MDEFEEAVKTAKKEAKKELQIKIKQKQADEARAAGKPLSKRGRPLLAKERWEHGDVDDSFLRNCDGFSAFAVHPKGSDYMEEVERKI